MHGVFRANGYIVGIDHSLYLTRLSHRVESRYGICYLNYFCVDSFSRRRSCGGHDHVVERLKIVSEALRTVLN